MPSRFTSLALSLGLSKTSVALLRTSGWLQPVSSVLAEQEIAVLDAESVAVSLPQQIAQQVSTMLKGSQSSALPMTVVLADEWVRLFIVTPPNNTVRLSDCKAAAAMRFQMLFGESPSGWQLEADWDVRNPFLVCAVPRDLITEIEGLAKQHQLTLMRIVPHFIATWNQWHRRLKPHAWFGIAHEGSLTIGAIERGALCAVRTVSAPVDMTSGGLWLADHLAREALRLNIAVPTAIQLCGDGVEIWITQSCPALACTTIATPRKVPRTALTPLPLSVAVMLAQTGLRQGVRR